MSVAKNVVDMRGAHACHRQRMDVERVVERRPKCDDLLHELGFAMRKYLRQDPAAAVADKRYARTGAVLQVLQSVEQRPKLDLRVHDVERDAGPQRPVPHSAPPTGHRAHRPVAGYEAWCG